MFNRSKPDPSEKSKSHLKNLMAIAMADGRLAEEERHILISVAHRLGLSEEEVQMVQDNPDSVKFTPPKAYDEKMEQIYDFISLMSVDSDIDPSEVEVCRKLALHLDLAPRIVDDLLEKFFGDLK